MRHALALLLVTTFVPALLAQDTEFIRALERAQERRPATLTSTARIAAEGEPGTPLVIRGKVVAEDGKTPMAGAIVFAYHTDRSGLYDEANAPAHSWRIRGWARTSADGSFEFRTIRPGAYPSRRIPSHVHFTVFTDNGRYHAGELRFEDDELVPTEERASSSKQGAFGSVRPVRKAGGSDMVDYAIRLKPAERF
jgi:protocatechuate 3,4-dioxygenase beta subunit